MEQKIKQRLAGAITIVSLAVIFLPLIFDGSGYKQLPNIDLNIPAQPEIIIDQKFEMLPSSGESGLKHLREEIDLQTMIKTPSREQVPTDLWKVQVGVFANEENAKDQVRALQKKGYSVYYRSMLNAGEKKFFVEIGPDNKQKIQQITKELKGVLGMQDILVKRQ